MKKQQTKRDRKEPSVSGLEQISAPHRQRQFNTGETDVDGEGQKWQILFII